jgi:septation ring formation regulator EzrA
MAKKESAGVRRKRIPEEAEGLLQQAEDKIREVAAEFESITDNWAETDLENSEKYHRYEELTAELHHIANEAESARYSIDNIEF